MFHPRTCGLTRLDAMSASFCLTQTNCYGTLKSEICKFNIKMSTERRLSRRSFITLLGCAAGGFLLNSCIAPSKPTVEKKTDLPPTNSPVPTGTPVPEVKATAIFIPEPTRNPNRVIITTISDLPTLAEQYPQVGSDNGDPYYLWYLYNGGEKLFEPLQIPKGTELVVPNFTDQPPLLTEIKTSPENWTNNLGNFETYLIVYADRTENIRVATEKLNGTIIEPYKLFSMNETIGPVTKEEGYLMGYAYVDGEEVPFIGGGICQVSSTLFKPALQAGLLAVQRVAHEFYSRLYGPWDATVSDVVDLTIRNLYSFPVQIRAKLEEDILKISVWSPEPIPYDEVSLKELKNQANEDGSRDAEVEQMVKWGTKTRVRIYPSHYQPKP